MSGALAYHKFVADELSLEGTSSFLDAIDVQDDEVVIFGWVVFPSKEVRDVSSETMPKDPHLAELVAPLMSTDKLIFDASRMVYGGFKALV